MTQPPPSTPSLEGAPGVPIEPWPSEGALKALVLVVSVLVWGVLITSLAGAVLVALVFLVLLLRRAVLIARLRGSAIRIGPQQLPELYARVSELARRLGMQEVPAAYLIDDPSQRLVRATQFMRTRFLVIHARLLDVCGDDGDLRDFFLAHELARFAAGHLDLSWVFLPGRALPVIGSAYTRACTLTRDRYAFALARDPEKAIGAFVRLAAGERAASQVARRQWVSQRSELGTLWAQIGLWLSWRAPIVHRIAALDPALASDALARPRTGFKLAAAATLALLIALPLTGVALLAQSPALTRVASTVDDTSESGDSMPITPMTPELRGQVEEALLGLADAAEAHRTSEGRLPESDDVLYRTWQRLHPGAAEPIDPFDGQRYGYTVSEDRYILWSSGPDVEDESDDISYTSSDQPGQRGSFTLP